MWEEETTFGKMTIKEPEPGLLESGNRKDKNGKGNLVLEVGGYIMV